jgi:hypothetical protein
MNQVWYESSVGLWHMPWYSQEATISPNKKWQQNGCGKMCQKPRQNDIPFTPFSSSKIIKRGRTSKPFGTILKET